MTQGQKMNVVFFAIDTMRRDHSSCYGYEKRTTPEIDERIAKHGIVFDQCFSVSNCTLPGYTSMFSGLYPTSHDIVAHGNTWPARDGIVMLAELLHEKKRRDKAQRNRAIYHTHVTYGYTLKEIAVHLGVHYTTVSKVINDKDRQI